MTWERPQQSFSGWKRTLIKTRAKIRSTEIWALSSKNASSRGRMRISSSNKRKSCEKNGSLLWSKRPSQPSATLNSHPTSDRRVWIFSRELHLSHRCSRCAKILWTSRSRFQMSLTVRCRGSKWHLKACPSRPWVSTGAISANWNSDSACQWYFWD